MPTELEVKGKKALDRVKQKIGGNIANLTLLIRKKNPTAKISSCAITSSVLGDLVDPAWFFNETPKTVHMTVGGGTSKKKESSDEGFGALAGLRQKGTGFSEAVPLRQEQRVDAVERLLNTPNAVFITTVPDHYFTVFPLSDKEVVVLQGFQDVYNLVEWMENSASGGIVPRASFVDALHMLVSGEPKKREAAAVMLFAFDTDSRRAVADYYKESAEISQIAHKSL
jgi:hypothetical protein